MLILKARSARHGIAFIASPCNSIRLIWWFMKPKPFCRSISTIPVRIPLSKSFRISWLRRLYNISLCTYTFLIRFSDLIRQNMYVILAIFWKIKACSFRNWQNCIKKFEWRRTRAIQNEELKSLEQLFFSCDKHSFP